jgi:predicted amino acid racemase
MPVLEVDIEAIGRNTESVVALLRANALDLIAVTKGCLGEPRVAAAMLAGGAVGLADTRDLNLRRLRAAFPGVELHRIHLPSLAEDSEPGDVNYVSSVEGAEAVSRLAAGGSGVSSPRRVMIQVESGDEREGVPSEELALLAARVLEDPRLQLIGVSTNYACFRGRPEGIRQSVDALVVAAAGLRAAGYPVERVSGGNSSLLGLLVAGERLPSAVTELRCGEGLLLGQDALYYRPLPGCQTDACVLRAEVVEEYTKHVGGRLARRLVVSIGRQDLSMGAVRFVEPGLSEVGRSADYLVVEAGPDCAASMVGRMVDMIPSYEALVAAWTSPYVELRFQSL